MDIYFACGNTAYSSKMTDLSRTEDDKDSHVSGGETTGVATVEELFSDLADLNTDRETKTEVQDIKQLLTEAHEEDWLSRVFESSTQLTLSRHLSEVSSLPRHCSSRTGSSISAHISLSSLSTLSRSF